MQSRLAFELEILCHNCTWLSGSIERLVSGASRHCCRQTGTALQAGHQTHHWPTLLLDEVDVLAGIWAGPVMSLGEGAGVREGGRGAK